jgi:ABC-type amino acid transport substrate-binding protein
MKRQGYRIVVGSLIVLLVGVTSGYAQELVVGFGENNAEPYAFIEGEQLTGGIIKDLMDAVGKELGIDVQYKNIPPKRMKPYLRSGHIHVAPIWSPDWVEEHEQYNWSIPLFQESTVFVVDAQRAFPIQTLDDLRGKWVGTILGYYYVGLMEKFEREEIFRDDNKNIEWNFKKLEAGRIDALLDSNILIEYYLKKHNAHAQFLIAEKVVNTLYIQAMVSKQSPIPIERLNAAFQHLKDRGRIT